MNKDLIWLIIGSVLDNWSSDSIYFVYSHYSFLIATSLDIMSLSTKKDIDHNNLKSWKVSETWFSGYDKSLDKSKFYLNYAKKICYH